MQLSAAFNNQKHGIQPVVLYGAGKAQRRNCIFYVQYFASILNGLRMHVLFLTVGFGVALRY